MFCNNCGNKLGNKAKFCSKCGAHVVETTIGKDINRTVYQISDQVKYAGFWIRMGAFVIDYASSLIGGLIIGAIFGLTVEISFGLSFLVFPLYVLVSLSIYSTTFGKNAFGIKVIMKNNGDRLNFWKSLIRTLSYYISSAFLWAGFWMIGIDKKKQGLHDHFAGTIVIREKGYNLQYGMILLVLAIISIIFFFYLSGE